MSFSTETASTLGIIIIGLGSVSLILAIAVLSMLRGRRQPRAQSGHHARN